MKNTFAVTMTLLLLLTVGGSVVGYNNATKPHHAEAHEGEKGGEHAAEAPAQQGEAQGAEASSMQGMASEEAQTPAAEPQAQTEDTAATDGVNNTGSKVDANTNEPGTTGNTPENMAAAQTDTNAASADGDAAAGAEKYAATCAGCHGPQAQGGVGPALNEVKNWSLEDLTTALREGRTPTKTLNATMPRFVATQVSDQDIANLLAHLKGL